MNTDFDRSSIVQGNRLKKENQETPTTLAYTSGEVEPLPEKNLAAASETRMAGEKGVRALALMYDPEAQQITENWMREFEQSNQGVDFYAARMERDMMMNPPAPLPSEPSEPKSSEDEEKK